VRRHLRAVDPVVGLAARLAGDPCCSATVLADVSGWSTRQLRRRFDRAVGYGPAFYARVARLQRFATSALRWPERGLAELAASAGYTDQSHLGRETREIAGHTPTELAVTLAGTSVDVRSVPDATATVTRRWAA
jgi:transcriptional regulator GlxA family with amidase domain